MDWILNGRCTSLLRVSELTYTVSSGTLNPSTIPYRRKSTQFNNFGIQHSEETWHQKVINLPTHLWTVSVLPWEVQKVIFFLQFTTVISIKRLNFPTISRYSRQWVNYGTLLAIRYDKCSEWRHSATVAAAFGLLDGPHCSSAAYCGWSDRVLAICRHLASVCILWTFAVM